MKKYFLLLIFLIIFSVILSSSRFIPDLPILNDIRNFGRAASETDTNEKELNSHKVICIKNKKDIIFVYNILKYATYKDTHLRETPPDYVAFGFYIGDIRFICAGVSERLVATYHRKEYAVYLSKNAKKKLYNHFGYSPILF
jgi:hypothetical protein